MNKNKVSSKHKKESVEDCLNRFVFVCNSPEDKIRTLSYTAHNLSELYERGKSAGYAEAMTYSYTRLKLIQNIITHTLCVLAYLGALIFITYSIYINLKH